MRLDLHNPYPLPPLPDPIAGLGELAYNLWWSWQPEARALFARLDPELWASQDDNPVRFLRRVSPRRLAAAAQDAGFREAADAVLAALAAATGTTGATDERDGFAAAHPALAGRTGVFAYFSAEFGLHESLPIYSGGLGVLAGDHCKAASDLGVPLVAVGLLYPQGHFTQTIDATGRQGARYDALDVPNVPLRRAYVDGEPLSVSVEIGARPVHADVWVVLVGRVPVLLLDTDVPANVPSDREVGAKLYGGGPGNRLRQEMILGIGGVRALRAAGFAPAVWHLNEGHAAFAPLELAREHVAAGLPFEAARRAVGAATAFTTHTPVQAGHDEFQDDFVLAHFDGYPRQLGLSEEAFLALGRRVHDDGARFSMTSLAFHLAGHYNAVSEEHGRVSRRMWHDLWGHLAEDAVPIRTITNGVHRPTWMAPELGVAAAGRAPEAVAGGIAATADARLWEVHLGLKARLVEAVRRREGARRARLGWPGREATVTGLLRPDALTIGFARRFATYKRATLVFRDPERLAALLADPARPVQLVFAGKAHPADESGQALLAEIHRLSQAPPFAGRVVVVEDYDMALARLMTQGCDVWLNTPRRPREASGTSGQKAALNGRPNLSVADGWWLEGARGDNGWTIGAESAGSADPADESAVDEADAASLYRLLEEEVVPAFFERDADGLPRRWLALARAAIEAALPRFTAARMVAEYVEEVYLPAAFAAGGAGDQATGSLAAWADQVGLAWPPGQPGTPPPFGLPEPGELAALVRLDGLRPDQVRVELVAAREVAGHLAFEALVPMAFAGHGPNQLYRFAPSAAVPAAARYGVRVRPAESDGVQPPSLGEVHWFAPPPAGA